MKSFYRAGLLMLLILLAVIFTCYKIYPVVWCHDYTYFRVSGQDPSPVTKPGRGISVHDLRKYLESMKYKKFPYGNAASMPGAGNRLKKGDVIIIDDAHSGYINNRDSIDHFIQVFGSSGKKYTTSGLPRAPVPGKIGGLYINDSLQQFLNRRFKKSYNKIEVWRKH